MRTLNWYLDKAKENHDLKSDRSLSQALNAGANMVCQYRKLKSYPSPEMMIEIAKLADVPEEVALADLGYWSHFDTKAASVYKKMADTMSEMKGMAAGVGVLALISFGSPLGDTTAFASDLADINPAQSINYTH